MMRFINILLVAGLSALAPCASAFSLLGQFKTWQVSAIGYQLEGDIGGPQLGNEGYLWNIQTIYYAYDSSFISYFGKPGMAAVDAAIKIFNDLPAYSSITNDGSHFFIQGEEVPFDVRGPQNFSFAQAGLIDLKSQALQALIEEMGLAQPSRFTWTLRARNPDNTLNPPITNYTVVKLNFDPITLQPSSYVNGVAVDYQVDDPIMRRGVSFADATELIASTPEPYFGSAVADRFLGRGTYFFSLSHDDIGGLKFLYNKQNFAVETLVAGVTGNTVGSSGWAPYVGTNTITTNAFGTNITGSFVITGVRPGVNKVRFQKVKYDSLFSQLFVPVTNKYTDTVLRNYRAVQQNLSRGLTQPDLLFVAQDLGLVDNYVPFQYSRTTTAAWQNNDAINGNDGSTGDPFGGPGVINPQVTITFSDQLPYWLNSFPDFRDNTFDAPASAVWASFDENTENPVIYPLYLNLSLQDIEGQQP
jgi:hypothetical protein